MSVIVEHGTFGARAAAPIARDVMTYLFDPAKAMEVLAALESSWGGTPTERMETKYRIYASQVGTTAPKVGDDEAVKAAINKADSAQAPIESLPSNAPTTRPEEPTAATATGAALTPTPAPTPSPSPSAGPGEARP